jgi:hypothetical protein
MEEAIEKARKAVAECNLKSDSSHLKTIKTLLASLGACKKYIKDSAQSDRGCAQRIARSFDEILEQLPSMRLHVDDKSEAHTRRLAEDHLEKIQQQLSAVAKELEKQKKQEIVDWVKKHPVFGELKGKLAGELPKGAYVLLFRKSGEVGVELLTQTSKDDRVFTRFKPHEFKDAAKLHCYYQGKKTVVGAAIIAEKELVAVIGEVARPENVEDLLGHLLALSSEAASTPVREFLQSNTALKELHELSSRHKLPKQSYVLLFQSRSGQADGCDSSLELWERTTADGRTVTRFWPNEFADKYKLFDAFRDKPAVVGAAVIRENQLVKVIGRLPEPEEGKDQLQLILKESRLVMERPVFDFLEENQVLKGLNELANAGTLAKDVHVLLFAQAEAGKVEILAKPVGKMKSQARIPLAEFDSAKLLHARFSTGKRVVGASVVGQEKSAQTKTAGAASSRERADHGDSYRRQSVAAPKEVVLAAFGRTPLRVGHLATADTLRRLGINI